jgi:hypothetical protein
MLAGADLAGMSEAADAPRLPRQNERRGMEPIETPDFTFWMEDDGILRLRFPPGTKIDLAVAKRAVEAGLGIFRKHPCPMLAFLDEVKSLGHEARSYVSRATGPTAIGLVVGSPIGRVIGSMYIGLLRQPPYPVRMFATEEQALKWLKTFR